MWASGMQTTVVSSLPLTGFLRQKHILGEPKKGIVGPIPISPTQWWLGIREGRYPTPVRLGPHTVAWRAEDIHALIARLSARAVPDVPSPQVQKLVASRAKLRLQGTAAA